MRSFVYIFVFMTRINYSMLQTCSDIQEFEPVIHDVSETRARISSPAANVSSSIVINKIEYWHVNYLGCTKNETDGIVKVMKVSGKESDIHYLFPFSQYGIKILYSEDTLTCIKEAVFNTTKSANFNTKETPIVTQKFSATEAFFSIRWECQYLRGPISRTIDITCISQPCDGKTIEYTKNETVSTTDVQFNIDVNAAYLLKLNYHRDDENRYEEYVLDAHLKEPNRVRNVGAYSVNNTAVSLKWMPPEISTGYIDMYEVTYYYDVNDKKKVTIDESSNCRLWIEYICTTINDKFFNETYTFEIRAKNRGIDQLGKYKPIHIKFNGGGVPSEPLNIDYIWKDDSILNIEWEHPDAPNGKILQFYIDIFEELTFIYNVTRQLRYYNYEVNMSSYKLRSKKLFVGVAAVNEIGTSSRGVFTFGIPYFTQSSKVENITDSTFDIQLSSAASYGDKGDLYVIIQDMQSPIERDGLHPKERFWYDLVRIKNRAWIAGEFDLENVSKITIGDNSTSMSSRQDNMTFFNRMLESDHPYNMTLLLFANYLGVNKPRLLYSFYYQVVRTLPGASVINTYALSDYTDDDSFNYLWSLLLIPVLIGIVSAIIIKRRLNNIKSLERQYLSNVYTNPIEFQYNKEVDLYDEIVLDDQNFTKAVKIQALAEYIKNSIENDELAIQYHVLPEGPIKVHNDGCQLPNRAKNRYSKLVAYDVNRVTLKVIDGDPFSSYINASYIDGYDKRKAYIATQTPTDNTYSDFWRMIWQENIKYIIIASDLTEEEKEKDSGIYWPDINEELDFDDIKVLYRNVTVMANYEIRHFRLFCDHKERVVEQLHFFSAPDYIRVPLYIHSLASFMKKILSLEEDKSPIVVHCSDGIGYTGIIILCDMCLKMAIAEGQLDVFFHLYKLRKQRMNMVNRLEQYKVVHFALLRVLECLMIPTEAGLICDQSMESVIENILKMKIAQQMKYLEDSYWQDEAIRDIDFLYDTIPSERSFPNSEEPPHSQAYRYTTKADEEQFITTRIVDSFSTPSKFIVASNPLSTTLGILWQFVFDKQINVILCLNELSLITNYEVFHPLPMLEVTCVNFKINEYFEVYTLYANESQNKEHKLEVNIIHILEWPSDMDHPEDANRLIMPYEEMNRLGTAGGPILIICHDGIQASGLFVTMCFLLEKISTEHVCDVCLAVKNARQSRKDYVINVKQFTFLYHCALEYVRLFSMYSNFDLSVTDKESYTVYNIY